MENDPIFNTIATLVDSLDNKKSLEEVVKAFELVIEFVQKTHNLTQDEIENLRSMFVEAQHELKTGNAERFDTLKARLTAYCEDEMVKMKKSHEKMMQMCDEKMSEVEDGKDADEELIVEKVLSRIEIPEPKEVELDDGDEIIDKINTSSEGKVIDGSRVDITELEKKVDAKIVDRISLIPRGSGGKTGIQLYVNGVKKGLAQYIDLVAGPNVSITDSLVHGLHTITISATGGSGFTELSATETPDGSRTQFTFASATAQPSFLVVDNVWMKPTTALGTVNWTWNNGTKVATLSIPAQDDIWGVV